MCFQKRVCYEHLNLSWRLFQAFNSRNVENNFKNNQFFSSQNHIVWFTPTCFVWVFKSHSLKCDLFVILGCDLQVIVYLNQVVYVSISVLNCPDWFAVFLFADNCTSEHNCYDVGLTEIIHRIFSFWRQSKEVQ